MDSRVFAAAEQREFAALHEANGMNLAREGLFDGADGRSNEAGPRTMGAPTMPVIPDARFDARVSPLDKHVSRSRSAVMARHMQAQGQMTSGFERMQLNEMEMNARARMAHEAARHREMQQGERWARSYHDIRGAHQGSSSSWANEFAQGEGMRDQWAQEFQRSRTMHAPPPHAERWAQEFGANRGEAWGDEFTARNQNAWVDEFAQQRAREAPALDIAAQTAKQSGELAATLNADPKFANSKFAQLMSKLGSGQVVVKDDGLQQIGNAPQASHVAQGERWAREFETHNHQAGNWANQYAAQAAQRQMPMGQAWAQQYSQQATQRVTENEGKIDDWAEEFKNVPKEWASEFEEIQRTNPDWMENVWDEMQQNSLSERSNYKFTDPNPYLGQSGLHERTMELAKAGVLTEAVLAAEAWVRQDQKNSEAWYHLGRIQAENDDDQQAIAAMSKAYEANPRNTDVLLALAVSHANELDQGEALGHAREWLASQEQFRHIADAAAPATAESVMAMFQQAARQAPNNADVQTVLGVMAHITRDYEQAVNAFRRAATLRPDDHSLWNKVGATLANGADSADAVAAYRRALDIKPNYVRAWSNMGISYANQGRYAESLPYYLRALSMNPSHDSPTWGYVRISLGCTGRLDLMPRVDAHDVTALQREFPL